MIEIISDASHDITVATSQSSINETIKKC